LYLQVSAGGAVLLDGFGALENGAGADRDLLDQLGRRVFAVDK
jgi:hypothetical protein